MSGSSPISGSVSQTFKVDRLSVVVCRSSEALARYAASLALDYLRSLLNKQDTIRIILATGKSQLPFLEAMINASNLDWSKIVLFHLDEYLGNDPSHRGSFNYYLKSRVEAKIRSKQ